MRTLEEIAENPREATISENLILVADPYGYFKRECGGLSQGKMAEIIEALKDKFVQGGGLVSRFRSDLVSLESQKTIFVPYEIENFYQKLEIVMKTRPKMFVQQLMRLWHDRERIKKGKVKLNNNDKSAFEVVPYTHQWRHYVEKKKEYNPFDALNGVPDYGITLQLRENPNRGYPSYIFYGWQEKIKTRDNITKKLLYKIFKAMEEIEERDIFYEKAFGHDFATDYFGIKVIGILLDTISWNIGNFLHNNPDWIIVNYEDYTMSKSGRIRGKEYVLKRRKGVPESTEELQLQVTSLTDFLLDDFFKKDSHPRYKLRRDSELREYERENKKVYRRIEEAMNQVLAFLPR